MTTYFSDDFNRANSTSSLGTPVTGGPYTVVAGTWGINSSQAYTSVSTASSIVTFPSVADLDLSFQVPVQGANQAGVLFRYTDASNYWLIAGATGGMSVVRRAGGTSTTRITWAGLSTTDTIRLIAVGPTLYAYVNNLLRYYDYDTFNQAVTGGGLYINASTAARIDNVSVVDPPADPTLGYSGHVASAAGAGSNFYASGTYSKTTWQYRGRDSKAADLAGVS